MEKFGGLKQTQYLQQANDSLLTIIQIETKEALHNVCTLAHVAFVEEPCFESASSSMLLRKSQVSMSSSLVRSI